MIIINSIYSSLSINNFSVAHIYIPVQQRVSYTAILTRSKALTWMLSAFSKAEYNDMKTVHEDTSRNNGSFCSLDSFDVPDAISINYETGVFFSLTNSLCMIVILECTWLNWSPEGIYIYISLLTFFVSGNIEEDI